MASPVSAASMAKKAPVEKAGSKKAGPSKAPAKKAGLSKAPAKKAGVEKSAAEKRAPAPARVTDKKPSAPRRGKSPAKGPAEKKSTPADATPTSVAPVYRALRAAHPDAHCELDHRSPFELVVATVLSAQTTDVAVNKVTPELFRRFPTPAKLAAATQSEIEGCLSTLGMFRQKSKNIIGLATKLVQEHDGQVPSTLTELVALPGVGRKTANVVLGVAFGEPEGVVVDTHVQRISQRLGWTHETMPEQIEQALMKLLPRSEWDMLSHTLIFHGRRICTARSPSCSTCPVNDRCPSAFEAELVGRKPARAR